jgi:hypothetical protein
MVERRRRRGRHRYNNQRPICSCPQRQCPAAILCVLIIDSSAGCSELSYSLKYD